MSDSPLSGGCLCGSVRYALAEAPPAGEYCHCAMCRKASGSAFSANAVVPAAALRVTAGAEFISEYASSARRVKCFCARCGSHLFIRRGDGAQQTVVTLGSIDDHPLIPGPQRHVFVASKAPWHRVDDGLPQYRVYPGHEPQDD